MTEAKIIAGLLGIVIFLGALFFGFRAVYDAGDNAGAARIQTAWDENKAAIQKVTDDAIATATKQRDDAVQANQVLHDNYEQQLASISANSADFAKRLRNAQAIIAANSRSVPAGSGGQSDVSSSGSDSAQQLGQLVTLVTQLRAECIRNDDALDALYASVNQQPHTVQ